MRRTLLLAVLLVGCTSSDPSDDGQHVDLVSTPYTLQPGEEKYFCYAMDLPADRDIAITRMTPTYGAGTHHVLFSQTIAPEPEGFSECNVLIRTTWVPLYAGGLDSGPLQMPANTGIKPLERGGQVVMQLHLQNATDAPITASTAMRIEFVDATPDIKPASIYGLDNSKIEIPARATGAQSEMSCTIDKDLEVFAVMGHMHKHGVHLDVSRGATAGAEMLYEEDWKFEEQPVTPAAFHVSAGDKLFLRCTHKNDSDAPVLYGESSDTEMCSFVMYYAPAIGLDGCINQ
jgi:hypothetical protein